MVVLAEQGAIDADGVSATVVHVSGIAKPPLVVTTTRGVLTSSDGQSGTLIRLPADGDVVLLSACSAATTGSCGGYAYVRASDAALGSGTVVVELTCPAGASCKIPAEAYLPPDSRVILGSGQLTGSTSSGGSGGTHCTAADRRHANCTGPASGFHMVGPGSLCFVGGSFGSKPDGIFSNDLSNRIDLDDAAFSWTFADASDLHTGTYAVTAAKSVPWMAINLHNFYGDFDITTLARDGAGALTDFKVDFEAHCSPKLDDVPVCGCVRFVK